MARNHTARLARLEHRQAATRQETWPREPLERCTDLRDEFRRICADFGLDAAETPLPVLEAAVASRYYPAFAAAEDAAFDWLDALSWDAADVAEAIREAARKSAASLARAMAVCHAEGDAGPVDTPPSAVVNEGEPPLF